MTHTQGVAEEKSQPTSNLPDSATKAENPFAFGMDDPEFSEALADVLKDDEQAREAMKGLAQMMNLMS